MIGSGDCVEPEHVIARVGQGVRGVLVGRGVLRNPWILAQARDLAAGLPARTVTDQMRGQFLLDYIDLLLGDLTAEVSGFRHLAPSIDGPATYRPAQGRQRWVVNKVRALGTWYTKGLEGGSHLRVAINTAESVGALRDIVERFFFDHPPRVALTA